MAIEIICPACGEDDRRVLKPSREGERIFIDCDSCGHRWVRDSDRCPQCGGRSLVPMRIPVLQKARGTQQSIIGYRIGKQCNACDWASESPPDTSAV